MLRTGTEWGVWRLEPDSSAEGRDAHHKRSFVITGVGTKRYLHACSNHGTFAINISIEWSTSTSFELKT